MWVDAGKPRWANFRIHRSRKRFSIPLRELMEIGLRRAQVRYAEAKIGTGPPQPEPPKPEEQPAA
jgi:hypothetical protein